MPFNIGWTGILLIALVGLLIFGPKKLPQLGKAFGTTIREFRTSTKELVESDQEDGDVKKDARH
ncbi:twin-arginine translocase TatA/TatE family subunit [Paenibacillus sp. R14(2021)]|uniref:twin-arginine translocase TatA/TatE family subunit n=1 Tax=Paenibacillus sp. R14(2021) TaxID=2859228 RepID=UPI001C61279B|nr:twin-arginine translocase TatA/TatE family subunit [Paenibacillus sp. R14(2021)]